jgi:hypothetical protein
MWINKNLVHEVEDQTTVTKALRFVTWEVILTILRNALYAPVFYVSEIKQIWRVYAWIY